MVVQRYDGCSKYDPKFSMLGWLHINQTPPLGDSPLVVTICPAHPNPTFAAILTEKCNVSKDGYKEV